MENVSLLKEQNEPEGESTSGAEDKKKATQNTPARRARRFEKSRDKWKGNAKEKRNRIRTLEINVRDVTESRATWKDRARQAEAKIEVLKAELKEQLNNPASPNERKVLSKKQ